MERGPQKGQKLLEIVIYESRGGRCGREMGEKNELLGGRRFRRGSITRSSKGNLVDGRDHRKRAPSSNRRMNQLVHHNLTKDGVCGRVCQIGKGGLFVCGKKEGNN